MAEKKMMKELNEELELAGALARYIEMELKKKLPPPRKKETRPGYLTYNSDELLLQGMLLAMLTRLQGMNKWAARLWLEVLDVRVERLQDISREDIVAEGIQFMDKLPHPAETMINYKYSYLLPTRAAARQMISDIARHEFKEVWDTIYKKQPEYQWEANPWVWVITFEKKGGKK